MPVNPYFSNYRSKNEQNLIETLIHEAIQIEGMDCFYLPMSNISPRDLIYGEDPLKTFTSAFPIELYPENTMEYGGSTNFFSKFGLELRQTLTVILSKRTFDQRVSNGQTTTRPKEGDLIYIPVTNGQGELFEITFVHQNKDMSLMGRKNPFYYSLELEKFKYSQEVISTGISDIDIIQTLEATAQQFYFQSLNGMFNIGEIIYQSIDGTFANSSCQATLSAWDVPNSVMNLNQIVGNFSMNTVTYGVISNANCVFVETNSFIEAQQHADFDNNVLNTEANDYLDTSETNSFGTL